MFHLRTTFRRRTTLAWVLTAGTAVAIPFEAHSIPSPSTSNHRSGKPLAVQQIEPRAPEEIAAARASFVPPRSWQPIVLEDHFPVSERTLRKMKRRALRDRRALPPDVSLAAPSLSDFKANVQRTFAGINIGTISGPLISPPDTTAAASSSRVFEATNLAVRLTKDDGQNSLAMSLPEFFGQPASAFVFDPRVLFDRNSTQRRFFVLAVERNVLNEEAFLHLAVSRSATTQTLAPADWCFYKIDARSRIGTPEVKWADFPQLGIGPEALTVTTNQIPFHFGNVETILYAFDKNALENNAATCPTASLYKFQPSLVSGDINDVFISPVQHDSSPTSFVGVSNPAYLVGNALFDSTRYKLWRLANVASGSPTLSVATFHGSFYALAPEANQAGTTSTLDTFIPAISHASGVGNAIWAAHGTVCNVGGGTNESCARVLRITPGQAAGGAPTATLSQEITFGATTDGTSFWMPAIAANQVERTAVVFQTSSPTTFLSTWYTSKALVDVGYPQATAISQGTCSGQNLGRNGDYTSARVDPDFVNFWLAGENAGQTFPDICDWQTWVAKVRQ